jgi:hypothetical protein
MTSMSSDLASASRLVVPREVVHTTWNALRAYGDQGFEGFVLWLGNVVEKRVTVKVALVPAQSSIRGEDGVGYFVNSETLFQLNRELHRSGLRLVAQVHSHPTEAYHSSTDDAYAVVTTEGGFSIVVPNFATDEPDPTECAIYRLRMGRWKELSLREINETFDWESR